MISSLFLFGLHLAPLYKAIAMVESQRGFTSPNVYQIRSVYVQDVNRIYNLNGGYAYHSRDVFDRDKSEMMMYLYWKHYAYLASKLSGVEPTYEMLARIHNSGPDGWKKSSTVSYWKKVSAEMERNAK